MSSLMYAPYLLLDSFSPKTVGLPQLVVRGPEVTVNRLAAALVAVSLLG